MSVAEISPASSAPEAGADRFRLHRAGVLNVWQYDEQVFSFADGRLLLRGANGAGKSKTLEMLLPFALDGDKARITASAKHHTSLLWLMTDGLESGNRVGYVWVEFQRTTSTGSIESFTCGVGIRASTSARSATAWHFATDRRIGIDLELEDDAGPLTMPRLKEVLGHEHLFERSAEYKAHVGRRLFGLDPTQYDEVLRLLYWLRQPQIGEDIEPTKLAQQLSQALPQLDDQAVRAAGDTFDELTAFGEQIERRSAAAAALDTLAETYRGYARSVVATRARAVVGALRRERGLRAEAKAAAERLERTRAKRAETETEQQRAASGLAASEAGLATLLASPELRDRHRLLELQERSKQAALVATAADGRHRQQGESVTDRGVVAVDRSRAVQDGFAGFSRLVRELDTRLRRAVPDAFLPAIAVVDLKADEDSQRFALEAALENAAGAASAASSTVGRRLAAVRVVREALAELATAQREQQQAEREAARAESRWEQARAQRVAAQEAALEEESALLALLNAWAAAPFAPPLDLPEALTDDALDQLPSMARASASPQLSDLHQGRAREISRSEDAAAEADRLLEQRRAVEAERDPAPPPPPLPRTQRPDGAALWQVLDFADGVPPHVAGNLEAALQASGLLDAWIRPGGRLLGADHLDVVLTAGDGPRAGGPTLATQLVPDLPADCGLEVDDVQRVLMAVGCADAPSSDAWVGTDGRWRLGPAHGRAHKEVAQFIGATARAQERQRRLAVLDAAIAETIQRREVADRERQKLDRAIEALQLWIAAVPSGQALVRARATVETCRATEVQDEAANRLAHEAAHTARLATVRARTSMESLATEQQLPADTRALDAYEQELRALDDALQACGPRMTQLGTAVERWSEAVAELAGARAVLAEDDAARVEAERAAEAARAAYEALRTVVGDTAEVVQQKIEDTRSAIEEHRRARRAADERLIELIRTEGTEEHALSTARDRLQEHLDERAALLVSMAAVSHVPGMLQAAAPEHDDVGAVAGLADHPTSEPLSRTVRSLLEGLSDLSADDVTATSNRVWRAHTDAANGPAADHQPAVAEFGDLLAITARDDAGESPVVVLAVRVAAAVERDRDLLTQRERQQFEQHVLGELGDAIRARRRDAEELVVAMNEQLGQVSTSQGIRVRLDWKLRDDVPAEVRAAVQLLAQPVGALLPEERSRLRDVLHHLIEASRSEHPELSYSEHLAAALDYRTWSQFTIRYTRPEGRGQWDKLHRRSPLSQGEQKVLCYLPLFAAAAAHFTSLAGAAPHAPRLVLLDDAFPKIDVRTHPLLFGLLVQLDLDFVVTSERLWGDHSTVPSLAIYEALRDPGQRGIAQYEYRWDGRVLQGVG
ncbi:MAG TPA: TIGR02680 family protein [Actinomycetales bacterium]|nr:TIGR02680 family protein [Actinomycetales bacterium]